MRCTHQVYAGDAVVTWRADYPASHVEIDDGSVRPSRGGTRSDHRDRNALYSDVLQLLPERERESYCIMCIEFTNIVYIVMLSECGMYIINFITICRLI